MKVAILADVLGEANNGTSLAAYNLINHLKSKGHEVVVVCADVARKGQEGFYVVPTYNFGRLINKYVEKNEVVLAKASIEIFEEALKDVDIVHSMLPFSLGKNAVKYCKKHSIPITSGFHVQAENATSHVFCMNWEFANKFMYRNFWTKYYRHVDAIHYPTQFICDFVKQFNIKGKKEYVISNGVETKIFYPKEVKKPSEWNDKFVVLMSGRLCKEKNQILLLKAVKASKYEKDIQIVLTGSGPRRKKLEKFGNKYLTNKPHIQRYKHNELSDVLNMADLYIHTSKVEIEAISCLEAIACGVVPLISNSKKSATSKFALCPESLFESDSVKSLTKQLEYWFENREKLKEMSRIYADFVQQFDFDHCMEEMEKMLIETVENYKKDEK